MKTEANFLRLASHHRHVLIYFIKHRKPLSTEEYIYLPNCSEEQILSAMHWCLILPYEGKWRLSQVGKKVIETALKYGVL